MQLLKLYFMVLLVGGILFATSGQQANALSSKVTAGVVFQEVERRVIDDYFEKALRRQASTLDGHKGGKHKGKGKHKQKYKGKSKGLPPGLAGRKHLPPGIRKQIARGQRIPRDTKTYPLPDDLIRRLPTTHWDIERRVVGDDIVLVRRGTNLILDVLENVLRKR